ncbi:MAG: hypothetical protein QXL85_06970 [Candidatus Bathyarchaeia archaeon]
MFVESGKGRIYGPEKWRSFGYDTCSIVADLKFKNIEKHDTTSH